MNDPRDRIDKLTEELTQARRRTAELESEVSDLKRNEENLRESIDTYSRHFSIANDVIYSYDTTFTLLSVSPNVERILGYRLEDLIGKPFHEIGVLEGEDLGRALMDALHVLSGGKINATVYRFITKDGSKIFGEVSGIPLLRDGKVAGVISVARDITERIKSQEELRKHQDDLESLVLKRTEELLKVNESLRREIGERTQAEEALRVSEDKYRLLVENASEGIFVAQDGMLRYVNPRVAEIAGYSSEELTSRAFDFLIHPDDLPAVSDRHRRRMAGEVLPDIYSFRIIDREGKTKWIEINAVPVIWEGRTAALTFLVDVTERRHSEEALQASESKYRMLYDGMEDGFILADLTGRILEFNEPYRKMTGYEADELHRLTYMDITPPRWHESEASILQDQTQVKGYSEPYEKEYIRKDGTVFPIELRTYLLNDKEGKPTAMWAFVRDISERKRVEIALRESEARLRGIAENLPGAVYQFYVRANGEMGLYYISERTKDILGLDNRYEDFFERFTSCVAPEDREDFLRSIQERSHSTSNWDYEVRFITPSGEEKFIRGISRPREVEGELIFDGVLLDVTDQRRAEIELRKSERRFRDLAENTSDLIWETDEQLRFTYMSQKVREHLGYGPEDRVGRTLLDVIPVEDSARVRPFMLSLMEAPRAFQNLEYSALHQDGSVRIREASGVPIYDSAGRHAGYRGVTRDITERRKAEDQLRESEAKYRILTEKMNDIVWTVDNDFNITYESPSVEKVLGVTPEEHMGCTATVAMTPASAAMALDLFIMEFQRDGHSGVDPGRTAKIELEYYHRNGSRVWMEVVASFLRDMSGTIIGAHGVSRDITDRKRAEERIISSEKKFSAVFHSSPVPMVVTQPEDGMIIDCNLSAERWSGFSRDELIGHTTLEVGLWLDVYDRECFLDSVLNKRLSEISDMIFRLKDGSMSEVLTSARLIEVDGKNLMLTQLIDITDRIKAEQRIQASEKKLAAAFNSSPAPMVITSAADGTIIDANEACQEWSGYTLEEALGRSTTEMGFWQDPDKRSSFAREIMEKGVVDALEMLYITRSGELRDVLHSARFVEIEGKPCFLSHIQDVTEKNKAEKALKESEERLRGIAENFPGVVFQFYARDNGEMGVHYISERTREVLGLENDTGRFLDQAVACIAPEDRELFQASVREAIRTESPWDYICRFIKPGGGEIFVRGISQPARHEHELVFSGVLFDITEQKQLDEELKSHREKLEEMVMSRTSELSQTLELLTREIEVRKKTENTLRYREMELQKRGVELEEMNAALKVLLKQREEDRSAMEMNIITNMKTFILPHIERLETAELDDNQMKSVSMIKTHIEEITSPFTRRISSEFLGLTPAEIQVASLIREGKNSKEIARILNISINTVHTYRFNIRKKTGLKNNKVNLRSYLKTLE